MPIDEETVKRRYREFLDLAPLTMCIAGLPTSEGPVSYSPEQMETRAHTLSTAFRLARQMVREVVAGG
jgi:hypothetical protein